MNNHSDKKLGTEPIGKLVISLALPAVMAQVVNVLYNIVDRIYLGHIPDVGATALTGVGICYPILSIIAAFSNFVGTGGAPLAAIQLGKGNHDKAEEILGNGVVILLCFSLILSILFGIYKEPLLYAFGGSDITVPYGLDYLNIYLLGTIFVQLALGLNVYISCQGKGRIAMFSVLIGAVINIVLDPIFIFGLNMGVKGAAMATVISQACSAIWVLSYLCSKKSVIRIRKKYFRLNPKIVGGIAALGVSPFVMTSTESLVTITLNSGLQTYGGDTYVGALTIMQSIMQLCTVPMMGFAQGVMPIISYNYGAKNADRIKQTVKITLMVTCIFTFTYSMATYIFPGMFASVFTSDEELISLITKALPIFMGGIWIFGLQMTFQNAFLGMGQAKISLFLALLRKIVLLIPLAIILPKFMGVMGIYYAEPIADILAASTTGIMFFIFFKKKLLKEIEK